MKKFKHHTLKQYLDALARKAPAPGGGSAAALTAAMGAALVSMVANYSKGCGHSKQVESRVDAISKASNRIYRRLLELVDLDAQAYLGVVNARGASAAVKKRALAKAAAVPLEVCRLSYQAIQLTPYLVAHGNRHLMSDIEVAIELFQSGFNAAQITVRINR